MTTIPLDTRITAFIAGKPWLKVLLTLAMGTVAVRGMIKPLGTMNAKPHAVTEGSHRRRVHRVETQNDVTPTCHSKGVLPAIHKQPPEKYLSRFFVRAALVLGRHDRRSAGSRRTAPRDGA